MSGDNDTNYQLMDHVMVGIPSKVEYCVKLGIPFFSQLEYKEVDVECFPYRIACARRPARGNALEPFYSCRDPAHTMKAATRALCSPARFLRLGQLFVNHAHALSVNLAFR